MNHININDLVIPYSEITVEEYIVQLRIAIRHIESIKLSLLEKQLYVYDRGCDETVIDIYYKKDNDK